MDHARDLDQTHARPAGASDVAVDAAGRMSEALETVERARGHLYSAHQLIGQADFSFGDALDLVAQAGEPDLADELRRTLVGRNVITGRWTFQIVEDFDDGYYAQAREAERRVRAALVAGRRHVYEAELKQQRRTPGLPGHEATPASGE